MPDRHEYGRETWIPVADLIRPPDYQPSEFEYGRELIPGHSERIAENFDPYAFQRPTVVRRADGSYWPLDGNNRIMAAAIAGEVEIPCTLLEGLSVIEEAEAYLRINKDCARCSATSQFHATCISGDPESVALDALLLSHGLDARGLRRDHTMHFAAVSPIRSAVAFGGLDLVDVALTAMKKAFTVPPKKPWWGNTRIVQGTTEFFGTDKISPPPTEEEFVTIIQEEFITPQHLHERAIKDSGTMGGGSRQGRSGSSRTVRRQGDPVVKLLLSRLKTLRRNRKRNGSAYAAVARGRYL